MNLITKLRYKKYMSDRTDTCNTFDLEKIREFLKLKHTNFFKLNKFFQKNITVLECALKFAGKDAYMFYNFLDDDVKEYYKNSARACKNLFEHNYNKCRFYGYYHGYYFDNVSFETALTWFDDNVLLDDEIWPIIKEQDKELIFFKKEPQMQKRVVYINAALENRWLPSLVEQIKASGHATSYNLTFYFDVNYLSDETLKYIGTELEQLMVNNIYGYIKDTNNGNYDEKLLAKIQAEFKKQYADLKAAKREIDYKNSGAYEEKIKNSVDAFKIEG